MSWLHYDAFTYMYYDCDVGDFTLRVTASNLVDSETEDGYNKISMRIKADNEVFSAEGSQDWGSEFISIERRFIIKILEANKLLVRLNHYGDGKRIWPFDMSELHKVMTNNIDACPTTSDMVAQWAAKKNDLATQLTEQERKKKELTAEQTAFEKDQLSRLKSSYIGLIAVRVKDQWRYMGAEDDWGCDVYIIQDEDG